MPAVKRQLFFADPAVGTGPGATAEVIVYAGKTPQVPFDVQPFADFTGGVFVTAGDGTDVA